MIQEVTATVSYFGKIPSRADFVKTADNHQLMALLDRWAGESLEALSQNPNWKDLYDDASEIYYVFVGSRRRPVVCGHILPSHDASARRFPFLSALRFEVNNPLEFIGCCPLALSHVWAGLSRSIREVMEAEDAGALLQALGKTQYQINMDPKVYAASVNEFSETQTIGSLSALLKRSGNSDIELKQTLPALGLLLQPILLGGEEVTVDKALELPLPRDPLYRRFVAAFWLDMISNFVARGDFELVVLMTNDSSSRMIVGFNGADYQSLRAVMDPDAGKDYLISMGKADWVEEYVVADYNLNKYVSYLDRNDLSLKTAHRLFGETFLGV